MTDQQGNVSSAPTPAELATIMTDVAGKAQTVMLEFMRRQQSSFGHGHPSNIAEAFFEFTQNLMANPHKLVQAQFQLWQNYMELWHNAARRALGEEIAPHATPSPEDRRFRHEAWEENQLFDFIKQSYLVTARWLQSTVRNVDGLDDKTAQKVDFYTRQFMDALSPSNFIMTNPEVLQATIESRGENLLRGMKNFLGDLERGKGQLHIRMTDLEAFELGKNVATTPGKVVYQNDLMQLIQYEPATKEVYRRPLLISPPWINKYYILDLREKNSFIRWAVAQGHTVFIISWVNPDRELAERSFEDYMEDGLLTALRVTQDISGEHDVNVIGYCLGGTLLASTIGYLTAKHGGNGKANGKGKTPPLPIASATYLTTLVDFSDPGELGVFIDDAQLDALEKRMGEKGYLESSAMATTFNLLRANDLIWSFVINNYLLGKDPFPFDLLYWNSDSTRMPAAMHSFYLRKMYQENLLSKPGGISLKGVPVDVTKITTPSFLLSTREDHIAPWKTTYTATQLYAGPVRFVLAASGHIAGVVNPPEAAKYGYWTNDKNPANPDEWLRDTTEHKGSWWPEWAKWIAEFGGGKVAARKPGSAKYPPIEDAPGSYVKVRESS